MDSLPYIQGTINLIGVKLLLVYAAISGEASIRDPEQWFFFCPMQEREAQGGRPTRTTPSGYWKLTGSPSYVLSSQNLRIGWKKTMVFYTGRAPTGTKTKWKMNEYKALEEAVATTSSTHPKVYIPARLICYYTFLWKKKLLFLLSQWIILI